MTQTIHKNGFRFGHYLVHLDGGERWILLMDVAQAGAPIRYQDWESHTSHDAAERDDWSWTQWCTVDARFSAFRAAELVFRDETVLSVESIDEDDEQDGD
jgi:hypothetical protein